MVLGEGAVVASPNASIVNPSNSGTEVAPHNASIVNPSDSGAEVAPIMQVL